MTEAKRRSFIWLCVVSCIVFVAWLCRIIPRTAVHDFKDVLNSTRSVLYIGLFVGWGVSLSQRIVHPQVRQLLVGMDALMVLWLTARTLRFNLDAAPWLNRLLWYFYYLPMLGLPVLCVLLALTLDKSEVYRLPRKAHLLWVPTGLLLAGVLTNDLHQNFFVFSRTAPWEDVYTYNWGYPLTMGWITVCIVSAVGVIASKCRVPRVRRKMGLCLLPMLLMGVYAGLYILGIPVLRVLFGDMTVVNCLLTAATLECGIRCGLLQSNTGYEELLLASSLAVQITDEEHEVRYRSGSARPLDKAILDRAADHTVQLDAGTLLRSSSIQGGRVFWQVDISELVSVMERLQENRAELAEKTCLERQNYETVRQINELREKNRLYDLLQKETVPQMTLLNSLLTRYHAAPEMEKRPLLEQCAVVGSYLKRSANLLFLSQRQKMLAAAELRYALEESLGSLELAGVDCALTVLPDQPLSSAEALDCYHAFEAVVEQALGQLDALLVQVRWVENALELRLSVETAAELTPLTAAAHKWEHSDTNWILNYRFGGGDKC